MIIIYSQLESRPTYSTCVNTRS